MIAAETRPVATVAATQAVATHPSSLPGTRPSRDATVGLANGLAGCLIFVMAGTLFLIVLGVVFSFVRRSRQ